jgi:hypothetical protein
MICEDQARLRVYMESRLDRPFTKHARFLGSMVDDEIIGGVAYDDWTGLACSVHIAGEHPGWAGAELMYYGCYYPFVECNCETLLAEVTDPVVLELDKRVGFKVDFVRDNVRPEGPVYYLSMAKADCRWLKRGLHGRQSTSTPTRA